MSLCGELSVDTIAQNDSIPVFASTSDTVSGSDISTPATGMKIVTLPWCQNSIAYHGKRTVFVSFDVIRFHSASDVAIPLESISISQCNHETSFDGENSQVTLLSHLSSLRYDIRKTSVSLIIEKLLKLREANIMPEKRRREKQEVVVWNEKINSNLS